MKAVGTGAVAISLHGAGLLLRLGFMLALLQWSSAAVLGNYALLVGIDTVSIYLAGLEFHTFTARRYARNPTPQRFRVLARNHLVLLCATAPLAGLINMIGAYSLGFAMDGWKMFSLSILSISGALVQELGRYLILAHRPIHSIAVSFLRSAAWLPLALLFLEPEEEAIQIIIGLWTTASMLSVAWGTWALRDIFVTSAQPRWGYIWAGLRSAKGYYAVAAGTVLQGNLERFTLQLLIGPNAVGVFSFFQTLANTLPSLVQAGLLNIALPHILSNFGGRLPDRFAHLRHITLRSLQVCISVAILIFVAAAPVLAFMSRQEYMTMLWILPALMLSQILVTWTLPIHLALYAARFDNLLVTFMGGALLISLVLNGVLISAFGVVGAVLAPALVAVGTALFRHLCLRRLKAAGAL